MGRGPLKYAGAAERSYSLFKSRLIKLGYVDWNKRRRSLAALADMFIRITSINRACWPLPMSRQRRSESAVNPDLAVIAGTCGKFYKNPEFLYIC